jgi:glycerate 2-kinase
MSVGHEGREARRQMLDIFTAGVEAVQGRARVREFLRQRQDGAPVAVIAIGKAAVSMADGACEVLGEHLTDGLLITKAGYLEDDHRPSGRLRCLESAHPVPDESSLAAGHAVLEFLCAAPRGVHLLFLISGGASSLVEVPLAGISLGDIRRVNRWLMGSGMPIEAANAIRTRLSAIKGGRLAGALDGRPATVLLISDVAGDDPAVIGSGLLCAGSGSASIDGHALPHWLLALLRRGAGEQAAPDAASGAARIPHHVIASLDDAKRAAALRAADLGYAVSPGGDALRGDAVEAGRLLAREIRDMPPGVRIWGGETTVRLPLHPGRGGRSQSLALAAALELEDRGGCYLLAAGTDGTDGPTLDAGALVDAGTVARGSAAGLDARLCLIEADAGTFLQASADLVRTGPTGTNVTDLVLGLRTGTSG